MRGMPYTKASRPAEDQGPTNSFLREALEIHAASRPPKSPPRVMPVTPTLPRVPKKKNRRRA